MRRGLDYARCTADEVLIHFLRLRMQVEIVLLALLLIEVSGSAAGPVAVRLFQTDRRIFPAIRTAPKRNTPGHLTAPKQQRLALCCV